MKDKIQSNLIQTVFHQAYEGQDPNLSQPNGLSYHNKNKANRRIFALNAKFL